MYERNDLIMKMKKILLLCVLVYFIGIAGLVVGALLNAEGYVGIIAAIAASTGCIIYTIDRTNNTKSK